MPVLLLKTDRRGLESVPEIFLRIPLLILSLLELLLNAITYYFLPAVLPALRLTFSPTKRTPFPL